MRKRDTEQGARPTPERVQPAPAEKRISESPSIILLKEDNPRQGFIEVWEYREILKHLPEHLQHLITFLYKTGWRKSEAINLTWDMVDLSRKQVRLPKGYTKNDRLRIFPFDNALERMFQRLWNEKESAKSAIPFVFLNKKRSGRVLEFRCAWDTACEKAKVGVRLIHDMRRSAVRNMVESGVSEKVAMELSGHLTRTIFENYHIVSTDDLTKAVQKVSAAMEKAQKPPEKEKGGMIPNIPFRSAAHGGDFVEFNKGEMGWPDEFVRIRKPTEKEFRSFMEHQAQEYGIDHVKEYVKNNKDKKSEQKFVKWALEIIAAHEKKRITKKDDKGQ